MIVQILLATVKPDGLCWSFPMKVVVTFHQVTPNGIIYNLYTYKLLHLATV